MFPFQVTHLAEKASSPANENGEGVGFQGMDGVRNELFHNCSSYKNQNIT